MTENKLISNHGGYQKLKSFQVAQLVYDVTIDFCDTYIEKRSRTHDQMVQAARSGVQNIAEGSQASGTSKKTELKLTNVARASLEELKLDYEDYLRQHNMEQWQRQDIIRQNLIDQRCKTAEEVAVWVQQNLSGRRSGQLSGRTTPGGQQSGHSCTPMTTAGVTANAALVLLAVACVLLDRQIAAQAKAFETNGGFTERLYQIRTQTRKNNFS